MDIPARSHPLTDQNRRADIQGLRAVAVTSVVCFHAGVPISGGFTGVDIFFVISGFVITLLLMREQTSFEKTKLLNFYFRRFKRLAPALAIVVAATAILSFLVLSPLNSQIRIATLTGTGSLFMLANLAISHYTGGYFEPAAAQNPLVNTWSLSVEEQFYLFFPITILSALYIASRNPRWRSLPSLVVIVVGIVSFAIAVHGSSASGMLQKNSILTGFYSPFTRAWEFAVGALLALAANRTAPGNKFIVNALAATGAIIVGVGFFIISPQTPFPGFYTLLPVTGTALLIYAGTPGRNISYLSRALSCRPMLLLGDISYSLYLWHWPLIVFSGLAFGRSPATISLSVLLSLALAYASYRWVENPLRRSGPMSRRRGALLIGLTLSPPVLLCSILMFANSHGYWSPRIRDFQNIADTDHASVAAGCGQGFVPKTFVDSKCLWNASAKGTPIYLIGDSNADHLSEALMHASTKLGRPLGYVTKGGCAILGRSWSDRNDADQLQCTTFVDDVLALLSRSKPGTVIIAFSDSIFYGVGQAAVGPTRATETADPKIAYPYLQSELKNLVRRIQEAKHQVVLVQPVPKFFSTDFKTVLFDPAECATFSVLRGSCPERIALPESLENEMQAPTRNAIAETARTTRSELVDLRSFFCTQSACSNYGPEGLRYKNAGHITPDASAELGEIFTEALSKESPR